MTTELDRIAKKNINQKTDKIKKKLKIKQHNIKAAAKAHSADPDREPGLFGYGKKPTEKSKSLDKEYRKTKKSLDRLEKRDDKLHEHGVWSKDNKKGEAFASLEKDKQEAMRDVNKLRKTFARHDLDELTLAKPELMQSKINKASKRVLENLEKLTDPNQFDEEDSDNS